MDSQPIYPKIADERGDALELRACVQNTVNKLLNEHTSTGKPGILLGKIQAGKTRAFLGVIACAFDSGYDIAVILTKGTVSLARQTIRRVQKDFEHCLDDEGDTVRVFDIMSLPENLTKYELNRKLIIVVKKEDDNLKRLIRAFKHQYPVLKGRKLLIVDDEADFASVTFKKKGGEVVTGVIAGQIDQVRDIVQDSAFLQVTATPYSLYLQPDETVLKNGSPLFSPKRPAFTELLPTHPEYVGGEHYFEKSSDPESTAYFFYEEVPMQERETLKKPDGRRLNVKNVLTEKNVKVLRSAIMNFVVGATVRRLQQQKNKEPLRKYSWLMHTEMAKESHDWQERVTYELRNQLEQAAMDNAPILDELLAESYPNIEKSVKVGGSWMPSLQEVRVAVHDALTSGFLRITKVNSDKDVEELLDDDGQLRLSTPMNLFIGGQILDRGVTLRNLIGFYYGRNPQKFQQDTVLQHSRMYGARPAADLSVTRFYAPRRTYQIMQKIHQFDSALREAFEKGEHDKGVYFIRKDPQNQLVPCSPNRLYFSKLTSIKPGSRLLPVGFNTVFKSYGKKRLEELDALIQELYGSQWGKPVSLDLKDALRLLGLANNNLEFDENDEFDDERKAHVAALEHLSSKAEGKHQNKVTIVAHTNRDIERLRSDGRISNSPDSYQEKGVARHEAQHAPVLLLLRQNGAESQGWRDLPFWWPVIFVPAKAITSVFASETPAEDAAAATASALL
jgi:hypothetical protein